MNIQFMTKEKNGVPTGKMDWRGEDVYVFVPDFDQLIQNASCKEETKAINDCKEHIENGIFKGFTFPIVWTGICKSSVYTDGKFGGFENKWQVLQHPWYEDIYGVKDSKEKMIMDIQSLYISTLQDMV